MPLDLKAELSITMPAEEWNLVLEALAEGKFRVVNPLIRKIVEQAQAAEGAAPAQGEERPRLQPIS